MATKLRFRRAAIKAGFKSHLEIRDALLEIIPDEAVALTTATRLWSDKEIRNATVDRVDLACWLFNCKPGDLYEYKRTKPVWKNRP
jgi:DNA-binding Xre family transcriptional regulator